MAKFYYLAYGSNLHPVRLNQRIPSAEIVTSIRLTKHRLTFHKQSSDGSAKCNLVHTGNVNDYACAAIYQIAKEHKKVLDWYEGTGFGYIDSEIEIVHQGRKYNCLTYLATHSHIVEHLQPYHWYKDLVIQGAKYFNFPTSYIESIAAIPSVEDKDRERRSENQALLEKLTLN